MRPVELPELNWQPCRCNDKSMGLNDNDYIMLMMFLQREKDCVKINHEEIE